MPKKPLIGDLIGASPPKIPFVETGEGGVYYLKLHYRTKTGSGHLTRQFKLTLETVFDLRDLMGVGNISFQSILNPDTILSIYVQANGAVSFEVRVLDESSQNIAECYAAYFGTTEIFTKQYPQFAFLFAGTHGAES